MIPDNTLCEVQQIGSDLLIKGGLRNVCQFVSEYSDPIDISCCGDTFVRTRAMNTLMP